MGNENSNNELSYKEDVDVLKSDADIPIEELHAMYTRMNQQEEEEGEKNDNVSDDDDDEEEYEPMIINEIDDETTIDEEERLNKNNNNVLSYQDEIKLLQQDCDEVSIDQLRSMYNQMEQQFQKTKKRIIIKEKK